MDTKSIIEAVFAKWAAAISETDIGTNYSMERSETVNTLPYASLFFMSVTGQGYDLSNIECGITADVQVDIYVKSTDKLSKLYELDEVSHQAMQEMGFRRTSGISFDMSDSGYKRLVNRYSRVIGFGDF